MENQKTIWIVNRYIMPPHYEPRIRYLKYAKYLQQAGYKVILFGSSVMHNMDINLIEDGSKFIRKQYEGIDFVFINTLEYNKTSKIKREISAYQFEYRFIKYAKYFEKPDFIIACSLPFLLNPVLSYAKRNHIIYIKESLDIWPDNFIDYGIFSANNPIMKLMFAQAKYNCAHSDACVFSWIGCFEYIKEKGWDKDSGGPVDMNKVHYINNGVDIEEFDYNKEHTILEDSDLVSDKKRIIYLGSIRQANKVEHLIHAAERVQDRPDVEFLIYGDGPDREKLISYCKSHNIQNVKFKDKWIDPKYVPYVVSQAYINVMNYHSSAFGKHGISSSKMFQYMAAGKPILCNIDIFKCFIKESNCGIARDLSTPELYADALIDLLSINENEYITMGQRAREKSHEFDYRTLTARLIEILKSFDS